MLGDIMASKSVNQQRQECRSVKGTSVSVRKENLRDTVRRQEYNRVSV